MRAGRLRHVRPPAWSNPASFRVAIAQICPRKADYPENLSRMGQVIAQVAALDPPADVVVFPETAATGYFLEGGVGELSTTAKQFAADLQAQYGGSRQLDVIAGFYENDEGELFNSAIYATLSADGPVIHQCHRKFFLPTYGVFDEGRFVRRGKTFGVFPTRFGNASVLICEDIWHSVSATIAALKGATMLYIVSASPGRGFQGEVADNQTKYRQLLVGTAEEHNLFVFNASMVGFEGGKGLIGGSMAVDPFGEVVAEAPHTEEALLVVDCDSADIESARASSPLLADLKSAFADVVEEFERVRASEEV